MAEETRRTKDEWVEETYRIFIKDAEGIDPTDPVKALEAYFAANAPEDLKARCAAEGKTAAKCWEFVRAVARKALKGSNGHIDPAVVYAIAMHFFQDVPVDWDKPQPSAAKQKASAKDLKAKAKSRAEEEKERAAREARENPLGLDAARVDVKPEDGKPSRPAKKPAKKPVRGPRTSQGFFFDLMERKEGSAE